ncbi:M56 family metallopeptidase [Lachnospiraceae bacterium 54-53]
MVLSSSSLITTLFICNLSIIAVWFFLNNHKRILQISISILLIGILLLLLRLLIPFEFSFQYTIFEKYLLPDIFTFFYIPVIVSNSLRIYVYHIFLLIWVCGIILFGFKTIYAYIKFKKIVEREPRINNRTLINLIKKVELLYGKSTDFTVIKTNSVSVPLLFGVFKPKIILPQLNLSNEELYYIIRHEVTHYYHYDLWIKLFVELIGIIYWWNPFVYILRQQIDKILEIRVDTAVTKGMSKAEKINYLECLLTIAKGNAPSSLNSFSLAFDSRTASVLSQRFYIVLDNNFYQKSRIKSSILFIVLMLILTLISLVVIEPYSIAPVDQQQTVELTAETAYLLVNPNGGYDIFLNGEYFGTVSEIKDSYSDLRTYKNAKEALYNECQK